MDNAAGSAQVDGMELAILLITLGILFLGGLVADTAGRYSPLPRVTMLLLLGMAVGAPGFDLLADEVTEWFDSLSIIALTMVAFLLGGSLADKSMRGRGRAIMILSLSVVAVTLVVVPAGLWVLGMDPALALILGAIATATAPAAIADVIRQEADESPFAQTLKGIVAIDDAWGLIAFSLVLAFVGQVDGGPSILMGTVHELGGAIALGLAIGVPAAFLTGRLSPGEPLQAEAMGIVFLTAGLALYLEVSFLVTGMVAGGVIGVLARHHERAFHEIEHIQWPFMILFFLLAGATLDVEALWSLGWLSAGYLVLRTLSRLAGGWAGARLAGLPRAERAWYGPALLPQAGVAVGMALVAREAVPDHAAAIMAFTIASTVVFELIGPAATLLALRRVRGAAAR